jgi:transposase
MGFRKCPAGVVCFRNMNDGRKPRVAEPQRNQAVIRFEMPADTLPATHRARVLWDVVCTLDLRKFLRGVKAVDGRAGRTTLSPRMKLVLWLYAISTGVGSAREIARLTRSDDAYRWIVGDLEVGHDTLSSFRVDHGAALDELMTDILASLMHKGVLSLDVVAQDGIRIRAAATAPSFRRLESLLECREQATLHLKAVLAQADDPELTRAQHAAREAAARDFQRRVEAAIATVAELQESRKPSDKPARASTTDAEARVMKMADGGFRPAYNVRMATAGSPLGGARTIVGIQVTNVGSDIGAITPMLDEIKWRTGQLPKTLLADANHAKHECIRAATAARVEAIVAVPERTRQGGTRLRARDADAGLRAQAADDPAIVAWRERMETDEAKLLYRARASLCELMNAHLRTHHGVDHFLVRGLAKVTCVVLLAALASNLLQHATALLA